MSFTPKCKTARQEDWYYQVVWEDEQGQVQEEVVAVPANNCSSVVVARMLNLADDTQLLKQRLP